MGRTTWDEVPAALRDEVAEVLGAPVVEAVSQAGGYSPGGADRIVTADGTRAFVKTLSRSRNADGFAFHEREAEVMALLPASVQAPALLATLRTTVDGDDWIALVLADVAGRHPGRDADGSEITAVLDALHTLPVVDGSTLAPIAPDLADGFAAWDRMAAAGTLPDLPPAVTAHVRRFTEAARGGATAVDGTHLVHADCRADNLLVDGAGLVWVIDWPWAAVGAHWLDPLTYLLDVLVRGERADVEHHLATHPVFDGVVDASVDAVLAGLAGMFLEKSTAPAPPNMPTLRAFQRTEGMAAAEWLLRRWGTRTSEAAAR